MSSHDLDYIRNRVCEIAETRIRHHRDNPDDLDTLFQTVMRTNQVSIFKLITDDREPRKEPPAPPKSKMEPNAHDPEYIKKRVCEIAEFRMQFRRENPNDREILAQALLEKRMADLQ